jgi:uncharacterized glyoxalase superfamily protein PhnB
MLLADPQREERPMTDTQTKAAPQVLSGVAPYLMLGDANAAGAFYQRAFGAKEVNRMPAGDGPRLLHLHLYINGASVMLMDAFPENGHPLQAPQAFTLHLQVDDVDAWFDRAVRAGAESVLPPQQMFWGDRYGQVRDPYGVLWSMGQTL